MVSQTRGALSKICGVGRSTALPSSSRGAELGDERSEPVEHAVRDAVTAAERHPLDLEPALAQEIAQVLAAGEGQNRVATPVALQHAQARSLLREGAPFRLGNGRAAQNDEPCGGARGAKRHVAGQHRALRKATEHDALARRLELLFARVEKSLHE